jgi:formamidopyrimidine-DNA glycosylase
MPELPDLQVFSKNLRKILKGRKIEKAKLIKPHNCNVSEMVLNRRLKQATIKDVERVGKELHFIMDNDNTLTIHLMLNGKLYFREADKKEKPEEDIPKHSLFEWYFQDGSNLILTDYGGLARTTLNPEETETPDALSNELTDELLIEKLAKRKTNIKKLLLDQHFIKGIGNAYADEILWEAKISPASIANKIPAEEIKVLNKAIKEVLEEAERQILASNPSIINGEIRDFLKIHNSKKETSPTGKAILVDTKGRKTYYTEEQILYT